MLTDWLADGDLLNFQVRAAKALAAKMEKIAYATGGYFFAVQMEEGGQNTVRDFIRYVGGYCCDAGERRHSAQPGLISSKRRTRPRKLVTTDIGFHVFCFPK